MVPWAPELSRGQCWQLSLTRIAMNEKLVRSLPRKRFCHQPLSYGLGGENRGNHSRGFFPLRRIGFVLTVSATWQIAKSFGKKHPHSSLIQIFGQKNRRANPKTLQAEHFVYFCVHVYANHSWLDLESVWCSYAKIFGWRMIGNCTRTKNNQRWT